MSQPPQLGSFYCSAGCSLSSKSLNTATDQNNRGCYWKSVARVDAAAAQLHPSPMPAMTATDNNDCVVCLSVSKERPFAYCRYDKLYIV